MRRRLTRDKRIRAEKDFHGLYQRGEFVKGRILRVWIGSRPVTRGKEAGPRIGVSVSSKVSPQAVKRNLWKRRIREAFRLNQERIAPGTDILIQARRSQTVPTVKEIEKELLELVSGRRGK